MQKPLRIFAASALLAGSGAVLALPFNSFDPRSMGMGGAGVAVADAGTAPFFNPALLTVGRAKDNFSLSLPVAGARAYDPSDFRTSLDDFQKGDYVNTLQNSINAYNATHSATSLTAIANNISSLSTQLATLSDKPIQGEAGAGMVVGIPGKTVGGAFFVNGWGAAGGVIKYKDSQTLQNFSTAVARVQSCGTNQTCLSALGSDPTVTRYVNLSNPASPQVAFNTNNLQSSVDIRGVGLAEVGFALSRQYRSGKTAWSFGMTPKIVDVYLYEYSAKVDNSDTSKATGKDYKASYRKFNFDLGLAKDYGNGWRSGFVVKNVIPHTYDFKNAPTPGAEPVPTGDTIRLKPQARIGASHSTNWSTVAMDLDLTANDPAGLEEKSRYLSLGTELNAWDWLQLRLGYRANLVDSKRNIPSVGLGLAPFGTLHIDVAVSKSANEVGGSARLAFTY